MYSRLVLIYVGTLLLTTTIYTYPRWGVTKLLTNTNLHVQISKQITEVMSCDFL